ncbi:MAG: hypothetical protein OEY52_14430 [Gammaproteobacteria bacterium]|nr:hypothetical protein [Gammaproteobacteria bacterium]
MYPDPIPPHIHSVDEIIEALCQEGCQAVRLYIDQLESNSPIELLNGLDDLEKQKILNELQSIMSVYDRCQLEAPLDHAMEAENQGSC